MPTCRVAEKGMRTMWLARSKALAWALVLLGSSTVGVLAFAQRPKEPAKPDMPAAQAVGAPPPAVEEGRVTDKSPEVSRVLPVAEGSVRCVAFGPEGQIAAGYYVISGVIFGGGVVVFDARGERLRPAPLAVREGLVTGVAFGPEGRIAAGYFGDPGGVVVFDARGERLFRAPLAVREGHVSGVAFGPEGRIAAGYYDADGRGRFLGRSGVVVFDARGAAPPGAAGGQGGPGHECGLRPGGPDRRRLLRWRRRGGLRRARGAAPPGAAGGRGGRRQ